MKTHRCNKEAEIAVIQVHIEEIHKAVVGNGREGILARFNKMEGGISAFKWIAGGGGILGIIGFVISLIIR